MCRRSSCRRTGYEKVKFAVKIAIIGCNGQLGWELERRGKRRGMDTLALDCPEIDISDPASIDSRIDFSNIDLIINAAAYTAVDRAESEPEAAFAVNRDGPANLAKRCRDRGIPLIHVSTDYVFDGTKQGGYTEEDPVAPLGVYGESKAAGEAEVRKILPEHFILRTAWLCGVHGHNFVKTMLKLGRERDTLKVVSDQFGCPTFAADLAEAILEVVCQAKKNQSVKWGTYHYCGAGKTTWHGFATAIFEIARQYEKLTVESVVPISTAEYPTPVKRPANSVLDCSKIERKFGIRPRPWRESLTEMIEQLYKLNIIKTGRKE
jgi:dTDP-4-dehydrorhamnose reductase